MRARLAAAEPPYVQRPQIWEFPSADFLVCAREDVEGLYIFNPTGRLAWEISKRFQDFNEAAEIFAEQCGVPLEQARSDLARVRSDWSSGLLAARQVPELIARPVLSCNSDSPVFSADYALFGRAIRLRLYGADIALDLTPRVEPLRTSPGDPDTVIDVFDDGVAFQVMVDGCSVASEDTLYGARVVVLQQFLKASRPEKWLAVLHAGACGSGPRCIVFPACSHSGKSTLAAALLHQGLTFYGDDSIPLERGSLKIQPMPFALMIREGSWAALSAMFPDLLEADTLDRWGEKVRFLNPPAPAQRFDSMAAAIVFTQYIAGNKIDLQRLQTFDALLRLEASGLWVDHDPEGIGDFLRWFESLPSYSLTYSDLAEAGEVLRSLLAA